MNRKLRLDQTKHYEQAVAAERLGEMLVAFVEGHEHARSIGGEQGDIPGWDDFVIEPIPVSQETTGFNTAVNWQETYKVEVVQKQQKFYINSGSHATFKEGKSRTTLPINLPDNTVKWYYEFSASRNENEVDNVSNVLDLAGELSSLLNQSGILQLGINMLNQPPGSNYCDIYLIDHDNYTPFLSKQQFTQYPEGTRENLKSGIVEVECCYDSPLYLGLKNPDYKDGVHVIVEVVAIVKEEGWVMHHQD